MGDDAQVIGRVLGGDLEAFRILVERYQRPLFGLVRNLLPNPSDWEDTTQEVFLTAYTCLGSYDPGRGAFATWLLTIARNKCFNLLKKRQPLVWAAMPETADPHSPEAPLAAEEFERQLEVALAALPFEQKAAFVLAEIQGLSYEEISQIEKVSLGTVKSRLSRAKEKLRALFQQAAE
jgi:RNA polymerase sigma-70 factor (ECF subfamily)